MTLERAKVTINPPDVTGVIPREALHSGRRPQGRAAQPTSPGAHVNSRHATQPAQATFVGHRPTRRGLLLGYRALDAVGGALLPPHGPQAPARSEVREVAPGVFLHPGLQEDMTAQNFGGIANIGFVVGEKCVAMIDSGGTKLLGDALRQAVKRQDRQTDLLRDQLPRSPGPHLRQCRLQGREAHFRRPSQAAGSDGDARPGVRNALNRNLGAAAEGSEIVPPTVLVRDTLDLDLGGRTLQLTGLADSPHGQRSDGLRSPRPARCGWQICYSSGISRSWTAAFAGGSR